MISTGIVRSIDSLGRVVLPKELRNTYGITPDTPLEIFTDGEAIVLRKYHAQGSCVFCGDISPDAVLLDAAGAVVVATRVDPCAVRALKRDGDGLSGCVWRSRRR